MENSKNNDDAGRDDAPASSRERASHGFTPDALARVLHALAVTPETPLFVAYSGGVDSHALLHALAQLRATMPWQVYALHIDHQLQPASAQWARHCLDVCERLNVPCHVERIDVSNIAEYGLEDAARRARYAAFARLLPANAALLVAHHQDDQAETVLLQLLRGAGVHGLAAMPMRGALSGHRLLRPLLPFRRTELEAYARANGLHWISDTSNNDTRHARNFLRHDILPLLESRWPGAAANIARVARHQAEAALLLDEIAAADLNVITEAGELSVSHLRQLSPAHQSNALRLWIRRHHVKLPPETVLREILARIRSDARTAHAEIHWADAVVRRYRDRLVLMPPPVDTPDAWEVPWELDTPLLLPGLQRVLHAQPSMGAGLSRARTEGKVARVRLRRGGEQCLLRGHHRKLKKLLQEAGVPPWERAYLPLVYIDGDLAAIGDRWVCDPFRAAGSEAGFSLVLRDC